MLRLQCKIIIEHNEKVAKKNAGNKKNLIFAEWQMIGYSFYFLER